MAEAQRKRVIEGLRAIQHDKAVHGLALDGVGDTNRAGLRDGRVGDESRLELGRADSFAGDVERVVRAAMQKPFAVLLVRRPVSVGPEAVVAIPIRLEVAVGGVP